MEATECGIRVVARFRPVDAREAREGNKAASPVSFPPDVSVVHIADPRNKREPLTFMLDRVFEHASQVGVGVFDLEVALWCVFCVFLWLTIFVPFPVVVVVLGPSPFE